MSDPDRRPLLEQLGRFYGEQHFAVNFTECIDPARGNPKRCTARGWDKTPPLASAEFAAGLIGRGGLTRNPVIVLRPSNLIVLECDGEEDLARISELDLPRTLTVQSSTPYKRHFYFRPDPQLTTLPSVAYRFEKGRLTADDGRYFLAPPSIHPSGAVYSFLSGLGPGETEIATLPFEVYERLEREAGVSRREVANTPGAPIAETFRNSSLASLAGAMRRVGATTSEILAALRATNTARCRPPLDDDEVVQIAESIARYTPAPLPSQNGALPDEEEPGIPDILAPHSWHPIDLIATAAEPPEPPTISNLVYPGRRHLFSGEPESLKSWAAMILCAEQIRQGHTTAYIDFEMGGRETLSRLRDLGLTDQELTESFLYISPDEKFEDPEILADTDALLQERHPTLIILDAFTGALGVHQLDPNKSVDIEHFYRNVIDPLRRHGAAVVVLDHLPKDPTNRGRFAIGSERKVGAAEVHLGFEAITPFGRGRVGMVKITTHKDRPGHLNRPRAAELELRSDPTDHHVTWTLTHPDPLEPGEPFRPTHLMEKISRYQELHGQPSSLTHIEENVTGRGEFLRKALDQLATEGYLREDAGPRNSRLFTSVKPYREDDDSALSNDRVPPRPDPVPDALEDDPVTASPPSRGTGSTRDAVEGPKTGDRVPELGDAVEDDEPGLPNPDDDIPF